MDNLTAIIFHTFYPRLVSLLFKSHFVDPETRLRNTRELQDLLEFFVAQLPPKLLSSLNDCMAKTLRPILAPGSQEEIGDAIAYFKDTVEATCDSILKTYDPYARREARIAKCLELWGAYHKNFFACLTRAMREHGYTIPFLAEPVGEDSA